MVECFLTLGDGHRIRGSEMNRSTFEELLRCAQRAGIEVRHASLGGDAGGLAMIRGKRLLVVDKDAEPEDQAEKIRVGD